MPDRMILLVCVAILVALGWPVRGPAQHLDTEGVGVLTDAERAEDALTAAIMKPWTGDLEGMIERGYVRIGVGNEPVFFSYDRAEQQGLSVDSAREFEKHLRETLGKKAATLTVSLAPLRGTA